MLALLILLAETLFSNTLSLLAEIHVFLEEAEIRVSFTNVCVCPILLCDRLISKVK